MASSNLRHAGKVAAPPKRSTATPRVHRKKGDAGVRAAMAEVKLGQTVPADDVEAWIESWDSPDELPPPEPGRR